MSRWECNSSCHCPQRTAVVGCRKVPRVLPIPTGLDDQWPRGSGRSGGRRLRGIAPPPAKTLSLAPIPKVTEGLGAAGALAGSAGLTGSTGETRACAEIAKQATSIDVKVSRCARRRRLAAKTLQHFETIRPPFLVSILRLPSEGFTLHRTDCQVET